MPTLTYKTTINVPVDTLRAWHCRQGAFERLLPPWQETAVTQLPATISPGEKVEVVIRQFFLKTRIISKITHVDERGNFTDEMQTGPFKKWTHEHRFEPLDKKTSRMIDTLNYTLPGGKLVAGLMGGSVKQEIDKVFAYRHRILKADLERLRGKAPPTPCNILIAGGTGLVGSSLRPYLETLGHRVLLLTRIKSANEACIHWNPTTGQIDRDRLEGIDAVINLSGANIAGARWSVKRKKILLDSRVESTRFLCRTIAQLKKKPRVFINASATGIYAFDEKRHPEGDPPGNHFLATLCRDWESAADSVRKTGIRTVLLRLGVVLTPKGGALMKMLPAFKSGLGGPVGSGRQKMSYIGIDDLLDIINLAIEDNSLDGPVNAVCPHPVSQKEFARQLAEKLGRPAFLPLPAFMVKLLFGEMGEQTILSNNDVYPQRLMDKSYPFRAPELSEILDQIL